MVLVISLWLPAWLCFLSLSGCANGSSGVLRPIDPATEGAITNVVAKAVTAAPIIAPSRWSAAIEAGGAAVLALLAAWQGLTHNRVNKLVGKPADEKDNQSK